MSEYQEQFGDQHQGSQEQYMHINDYHENRQQRNSEQQVDDSPFEELQNIMNQEQNQSSRNEILLTQKVNQLEDKCQKLFKTNSFLTKRIEHMHLELKQQTENQLDLSQLELNFDQIQSQLDNYKKEWEQFRNRQNSSQDKRISQIQQLVKTIQQQKQQIAMLQLEKTDLIDTNVSLQRTNRNLEQEIQGLEGQLNQERSNRQLIQERSNRQYSSKVRSFSRHTNSAFEDEVQAQLEQLIQKLMAQLQFQRSSHKKSMMEIKRMQQQILQLQREIVAKNNKIYQIQMQNLKGQKMQNKSNTQKMLENNSKSDRVKQQNNEAYKSKSDRNNKSVLKSFTIQQLLSGSIDINQKERYIIASKVIQFYLKKTEVNDLVPYNTDKIMISNYNKVNPSLIMIRKLPNSPYNGELSLSSLGWNLGVILSGLLIQWREDFEGQDQDEEFVGATIQRLLRQKLSEVEELYSLKSVVDQIIKTF